MRFSPGRSVDLEDGTSVEVVSRVEPFTPGLMAWDASAARTRVLAVCEDPSAPEGTRGLASTALRVVGPNRGARLGAVRRSRLRARHEHTAGYRDSALPAASDGGLVVFFSLEPTLPFARVMLQSPRAPWPPAVVARVGVELAQALSEGSCERVDPFSTGLTAGGAWLLDAGLDALLRPEIRARSGLRGSTAWLGYLAPEAVRRRGAEDAHANHFGARHGLGVLLHELLSGVPLYGGQTPLETLVALRRGLPELLSKTVPGIPIDVAACVHALLDHDALRRPEPSLVIDVLAPYAAPDLTWAQPLLDAYARPLGHMPFGARRTS